MLVRWVLGHRKHQVLHDSDEEKKKKKKKRKKRKKRKKNKDQDLCQSFQ